MQCMGSKATKVASSRVLLFTSCPIVKYAGIDQQWQHRPHHPTRTISWSNGFRTFTSSSSLSHGRFRLAETPDENDNTLSSRLIQSVFESGPSKNHMSPSSSIRLADKRSETRKLQSSSKPRPIKPPLLPGISPPLLPGIFTIQAKPNKDDESPSSRPLDPARSSSSFESEFNDDASSYDAEPEKSLKRYPTYRFQNSHSAAKPLVVPPLISLLDTPHNLSPAQLSRIAARAVRISARVKEYSDVIYILQSLLSSARDDKLLSTESPETTYPLESDEGSRRNEEYGKHTMQLLDFGRGVSPRLPYHCMLHTLLRNNSHERAGRCAGIMMRNDIRIRDVSLLALFHACCENRVLQTSDTFAPVGDRAASAHAKENNSEDLLGNTADPKALKTVVDGSRYVGIPYAYRILMHARRHGYSVVPQLYAILLDACVSNGEIVIASMLYGSMVNYTRAILPSGIFPANSMESARNSPQVRWLGALTTWIKAALSHERLDVNDEERYQAALQALTNIVVLVEDRVLTTGQLASLFNTITICPETDHKTWVQRNQTPVQVTAYSYLQSFLLRIIHAMQQGALPSITTSWIYILSRKAYHALIDHALRCQRSHSLAAGVFDYMAVGRPNPLDPTEETTNILSRWGTHLRRGDFSEEAWEKLSWNVSILSHGPTHAVHSWSAGGWEDQAEMRQQEISYIEGTKTVDKLSFEKTEDKRDEESIPTFRHFVSGSKANLCSEDEKGGYRNLASIQWPVAPPMPLPQTPERLQKVNWKRPRTYASGRSEITSKDRKRRNSR